MSTSASRACKIVRKNLTIFEIIFGHEKLNVILNHYLILVHQFNVNIYADMVFSNFLNRRTVCGRKCVITYRVYRTAEYQMIFKLFTHYSCQEMRVENEIWTNYYL